MKDVSKEVIDQLVSCKKLRVSYSKNGKYVKYNYDVACHGTDFEIWPFLNWCRGDVVRRDTFEILSKAPNKFFNLGENDSVTPDKFDWDSIAMITEKKDGFMILPYLDDNEEVQYSTRWSYDSPGCSLAKKYSTPELEEFISGHIKVGRYPLFELICEETFIKVQYKPEEYGIKLVNFSDINGKFLNWLNMNILDCVEYTKFYFHNSMVDIIEFVNSFEKATDFEGVVITFWDGRGVKVKADKYFQFDLSALIRLKSEYILDCILDKTIDDKLPFLPAGKRNEVSSIVSEMIDEMDDFRAMSAAFAGRYFSQFDSNRKNFALFMQEPQNKKYLHLTFPIIEGKPEKFDEILYKIIVGMFKNREVKDENMA